MEFKSDQNESLPPNRSKIEEELKSQEARLEALRKLRDKLEIGNTTSNEIIADLLTKNNPEDTVPTLDGLLANKAKFGKGIDQLNMDIALALTKIAELREELRKLGPEQ